MQPNRGTRVPTVKQKALRKASVEPFNESRLFNRSFEENGGGSLDYL